MARLVWNTEGQNRYEFGVDRGVFYAQENIDEYTNGTVWNGLVDVEEESLGGEVVSYHFDGVKYLDTVGPKTYQATISAYAVPLYFRLALGEKPIIPGFVLTRQGRSRFGLSYRTFIGDGKGYKIHIVYNAMAKPTKESYSTIEKDPKIDTSSWKIDAVPPPSVNYRPSAHYILDSTKLNPETLKALESILYGSASDPARLPSVKELISIVYKWAPLTIIPQITTGIADLINGTEDLYRTVDDGLNRALPETRLVDSETEGLYRLE